MSLLPIDYRARIMHVVDIQVCSSGLSPSMSVPVMHSNSYIEFIGQENTESSLSSSSSSNMHSSSSLLHHHRFQPYSIAIKPTFPAYYSSWPSHHSTRHLWYPTRPRLPVDPSVMKTHWATGRDLEFSIYERRNEVTSSNNK